MEACEIIVTLKGRTYSEVVEQARALVEGGEGPSAQPALPAPAKRGRKPAVAPVVAEAMEDDEELLDEEPAADEAEETADDDEMGFGDEEAEETEEEPVLKKAKKVTDKDVNDACLKHAKKHGRPKTAALLLKQFKVKSILELKAEQYPKVIAALKV